jgi:ATP-dependent 26S proteasome regulatory subunit
MARARAAARTVRPARAEPVAAWTDLADAVLRQEAHVAQLRFGDPDPYAGLRITEADVEDAAGDLAAPDRWSDARAEWDAEVGAAQVRFAECLAAPTRFAALAARAGLTVEEAEVFSVLCAVEADPQRQRLVAYVQDDVTKPWPTIEMLRLAFGPDHRGVFALAPDGALRRAALVTIADGEPWARQAPRVCDEVMWWLAGAEPPVAGLPPGAAVEALPLPEREPELHVADPGLIVVSGTDRVRRGQKIAALTRSDRALVVRAAADLEWAPIVRFATIAGMPVVAELDGPVPLPLRKAIEQATALRWVLSSSTAIAVDQLPHRPWIEQLAEPGALTAAEWERLTGGAPLGGHRIEAEQLALVEQVLRAGETDVDAAVRRLVHGMFDGLAVRTVPNRTWEDLVLAQPQLDQLHDLVARYRLRSQVLQDWGMGDGRAEGLVAMFCGVSGTGKTLAAEIVAGDLGLDLYRIDLSSITSKWVGETEKNLERAFAAGSAGNVVLFFDEADSLFGQRSATESSHDRYANLEVSYLLQRLERYDGLVILASNLVGNIDPAFRRRLHVLVDFPKPDQDERLRIWERCIPPSVPTKDVDLAELARRFELPGGNIRSAALTAGFLAAASGTPVAMPWLMVAIDRELAKLSQVSDPGAYGEHADLVGRPNEEIAEVVRGLR